MSLSLLCAHPPFQIDGNFGGTRLSFKWKDRRVTECTVTGGFDRYTVTSRGEHVEYTKG